MNYFGVTLGAAGLLRQLSPDPECTAITARIESMLWDELALLWHPKLFLSGAASGRSYTPNSIPVVSGLTTAAWLAYGDAATPSPAALGLFSKIGSPEALASGCVEWDLPFWQTCLAWMVAPEYFPTEDQYRATVEKAFPYSMTAKTSLGAYREHEVLQVTKKEAGELGGWWGGGASDVGTAYVPSAVLRSGGESILTSHMTQDLGLGTATRQMCRSSNFCFGAWRRAPKVETLADTRTLFMRYVINDQVEKAFLTQEQGNIDDNGRGGAAQSGPMAVAWYAGDEVEITGIRQLKTCAIFSLWHGNDFDEVILGDRNCPTLEGSSDAAEWVFLRDGGTYIGLHPLLLTQHGSEKVVEIKKVGCFRVVSFANHDGAPRDFLASALRQTGGGALVCMGTSAEHPGGFAAFCESCRAISIVDEGYQCQRHIHAKWGNREVEVLTDMQTMEVLWARTEEAFLAP